MIAMSLYMISPLYSLDMSYVLSIENRAKVAARYKVVQLVVTEQRWGSCVKGVNESLRNYKNCHGKLMETGSVTGKKRPSRQLSAAVQ